MDFFRTENIIKQYSNHLALDKVSINVNKGSIFGLLGPNGAGKTTLLRIINQITAPDSGSIYFKGKEFNKQDVIKIGYLPEERGLYKKMKVGEQALYLAQLKGMTKYDALKKLKYWFEKFEIQAWWNKKIEELSKGMQQKVQFITTVLHEPELLIFDEPFSGFDPINTNLLKQEILRLRDKGATVIFSTHNMASVEEICDHITLINKSKNILSGEINEIKQQYKSNLFTITFNGDFEKLKNVLNSDIEIIEKYNDKNTTTIKVNVNKKITDNDLLRKLMPIVHIVAYSEVIPSMNDVFITVVENQK